ncbi:MAG TPA: hypothetical protein VFG44_03540 [Burkholderiales bacterium]|nr:hypothetical protein [Burkholderiales bacterium]
MILRRECSLALEPLEDAFHVLANVRQRRGDDAPVFSRRQFGTHLSQQFGFVHHEPAFDHLAVNDAQHGDFVDIQPFARSGNAEEFPGVGRGDAKQQPDAVTVRDNALDDVHAIGQRLAQIQAGMREVLVAGVARQVEIAAAHAVVAGREHFLLDLGHRGSTL